MRGMCLPNRSHQRFYRSGNTTFLDGNLSCFFFRGKNGMLQRLLNMTLVALIWTFLGSTMGLSIFMT